VLNGNNIFQTTGNTTAINNCAGSGLLAKDIKNMDKKSVITIAPLIQREIV
jgi:hypothetical protein